ncbi:MAG: pilus assembly protein [Lachnospiraceae bacterium]|nr:pilus assembly protein [Lachnospiraceae bacterium]
MNDKRNGNCKHPSIYNMGVCWFYSFVDYNSPLEQGSLTLEASLVLPLFLFAMISCMLFGQMLIVEGKMKHGLVQATMEVATLEYYKERKHTKVSQAEIYAFQKQYSDMEDLPSAIKISTLNFLGTKIPNDMGELEIHMNYQMGINFPFVGEKSIWINEVMFQKAYTGYEPTAFELGNGYVYVTDFGSVYHKSLSCTHIMLSISASNQIKDMLDGKTRYRACEKCIKNKKDTFATLYIPSEGDCYHSTLACSGLKRTIHEITVWEIGGRKPCSRCGN